MAADQHGVVGEAVELLQGEAFAVEAASDEAAAAGAQVEGEQATHVDPPLIGS